MRLLAVWLLGLLASVAAGETVADHAGCQLMLPAGWVQDPDFTSRTRTWRAPATDPPPAAGADARAAHRAAERQRLAVTIGWQEADADTTAAGIAQLGWRLLAEHAPGELLGESATIIAGRTWHRLDYRFTLGNEVWRQRLLVTIDPARRRAWCVTVGCGAAGWDEAAPPLADLAPVILPGP